MTVRSFRRATAFGCAAVLVVGLGACSTSGSDDAADKTTTTKASASTTEAEETTTTEAERDSGDVAAAEELAESVNLKLDDFADGWTEEPADEDSDDGELDECFDGIDIDAIKIASVDSPTFSIESQDGSQAQFAQTSTAVFEDEAAAESVIAAASSEEFTTCAEAKLVDSFEGSGAEVTTDGLTPTGELGGLGDEDGGATGTLTLSANGTDTPGEVAMHYIRTENVVTAISLIDLGNIAFEDTLQGLLGEVSSNQADAIG